MCHNYLLLNCVDNIQRAADNVHTLVKLLFWKRISK